MAKKFKTQYTIRDIPEPTDSRLRETAAVEEISLNQAALQALQRGLGTGDHFVRYRSLHSLLHQKDEVDQASWRSTLAEMDRVNPKIGNKTVRLLIDSNRFIDFCSGDPEVVSRLESAVQVIVPLSSWQKFEWDHCFSNAG